MSELDTLITNAKKFTAKAETTEDTINDISKAVEKFQATLVKDKLDRKKETLLLQLKRLGTVVGSEGQVSPNTTLVYFQCKANTISNIEKYTKPTVSRVFMSSQKGKSCYDLQINSYTHISRSIVICDTAESFTQALQISNNSVIFLTDDKNALHRYKIISDTKSESDLTKYTRMYLTTGGWVCTTASTIADSSADLHTITFIQKYLYNILPDIPTSKIVLFDKNVRTRTLEALLRKTQENEIVSNGCEVNQRLYIHLDTFGRTDVAGIFRTITIDSRDLCISHKLLVKLIMRRKQILQYTTPLSEVVMGNTYRTPQYINAIVGMLKKANREHNLELRAHQMYAATLAIAGRSKILQVSVGLGKTRLVIAIAYALGIKRVIYFAEPGNIGEVFEEFKKLELPPPNRIKRPADIKELKAFNIASYSLLSRELASGVDSEHYKIFRRQVGYDLKGKFGLAVFDECQNVKNLKSNRTISAMQIGCNRTILMSGTTVANRIGELFSYAGIGGGMIDGVNKTSCLPSDVLSRKYRWRSEYSKTIHSLPPLYKNVNLMVKKAQHKPEICSSLIRSQVIKVYKDNKKIVKDASFRQKEKEYVVIVKPCKSQVELYMVAMGELADSFSSFTQPSEQESLARITLIQKISEIPSTISNEFADRLTNKQQTITDLAVEKLGEKRSVLLFTGFIAASEILYNTISTIHGSTFLLLSKMNPDKRFKVIQKFRNTPNSIIIGNIGILGKGFNLANADVVIMSDLPWSPAMYEQSIGRILRPDQEGTPEVFCVMNKHMIDQYKYEVLTSKTKTIAKYMRGQRNITIDDTKHIPYSRFARILVDEARRAGMIGTDATDIDLDDEFLEV